MRIPHALACILRLGFELALLQVRLGWLPLGFFELGPASFDKLRDNVSSLTFCRAYLADGIIV